MKKSILILSFLFLNLSCQDNTIQELEQKIIELEDKNKELQNYLDEKEDMDIIGSQLIGIPELRDFKVNKKGTINFGFMKYGKIRDYKVFLKNKEKNSSELIYDSLTNAQFKIEFTPKNLNDNELEVKAFFRSADKEKLIEIPSKIKLNVVQ